MQDKIQQKILHVLKKRLYIKKLPLNLYMLKKQNTTNTKNGDLKKNHDLVIGSYNVHKCIGTDKIFNPDRIIKVIAELDVDILALQEADKRFGDRVGLLDLALLQQETGLIPMPLQAMSPNGHGWHGNALFFRNGTLKNMLQIKLPGIEPRGALIAEMNTQYGLIRIIAAHFGLLHHSRSQQAKMIIKELQKMAKMPTIMIGDLNEWRLGKRSSLAHLTPYFDVTLGNTPSFPSRFPILALDRIFSYPEALIKTISCHSSPLAKIASDHLPIKATLDLKGAHTILKSEK